VPGGAGYVAASASASIDAIAAADEKGEISALSLGPAATLPTRVAATAARHALVVADLPDDGAGRRALVELVRERPAGELLLVVQRVGPESSSGQLLWAAATGLPGAGQRELTSATTKDRGLFAAVDLAPTILGWLGLRVPTEMRGRNLEADGALDSGGLRALMARLRVVGGRRLPALGLLLACWAALLLAAAPWPRARAGIVRAGALGVMWAPLAAMATAALEPGAALEYAGVIVLCLGLGALTDLLLPWPRALIAPALVVPAAITIDALARSELLTRSLVGPNPLLGARFYGIGNELKSGLAVLVLAAVGSALAASPRSRRAAAAAIVAGAALATIEGAAQIGAGVGGVILVCAGAAVMSAMLLPGKLTRRRALLVLIAPVAGLLALAAIDLATAHGGGHFTGSVLHARSAADVRDILVRRYKAAWGELHNHAMPVATALALLAAATGVRRRARLLAPVGGQQAWLAALCGGLAAGVVGALVEDSGPVLLVVAVFVLGCVLSYLWAPPALPPTALLSGRRVRPGPSTRRSRAGG
jgi:hypothetical protein